MSSSGQYQSACATGGQIYISTTYGNTWTSSTAPTNEIWTSLAMSSSGQYQSACSNESIYISTTYGNTWTAPSTQPTSSPFPAYWVSIAMSSSGQYQTSCCTQVSTNLNWGIYNSIDYGNTWVLGSATGFESSVTSIALSASGQYQSACTVETGIYTLANTIQQGMGSVSLNSINITPPNTNWSITPIGVANFSTVSAANISATGTAATITATGNITATAGNIIATIGNITATAGTVTAVSINATSDYRLKEEVKPLLLEEFSVDNLNPVYFKFKETKQESIGLIAHELQEYIPFLVNGIKDGPDIQSVNYIGLIGILIKEIKTLKYSLKQIYNNNLTLVPTDRLTLVPIDRPTEKIEGTMYYDKNDNKMYYYNGTEWV
jgi:hypothetical protein